MNVWQRYVDEGQGWMDIHQGTHGDVYTIGCQQGHVAIGQTPYDSNAQPYRHLGKIGIGKIEG